MTDTDRQPGGDWRTLAEAAAALGKSTRTVRRYVTSGKLEADKSKTPMIVNLSDMADQLTDADRQTPADCQTQIEECQTELDTCRTRVEGLQGEISQLKATHKEREAEAQGLRAQVDHLKGTNELLQEILNEVREERDYLRQANAAALSKIPDQGPGIWRRLLPWVGGEGEEG